MARFQKILRISIFVLAGGAVLLAGLTIRLRMTRAQVTADYGEVPAFHLIDQTGAAVSRDGLKGHPWIASFIFTRCQGPCPLMAYRTSELQKDIANPKLKFVSFSVDPEYDTPSVLASYAKTYSADPARWFFATGDKKTIFDLIRTGFHLAIEGADKTDDNQILHSTYFILVDGQSHIRGYFNSTDLAALADLKAQVKRLL